jgi:hypothetical protein
MRPLRCLKTTGNNHHDDVPKRQVQGNQRRGPISNIFLDLLTLEDGTDRLSRNVCKGLPLDAA